MNYVGSISILDRGDAPAQAVIDRNARSLAQRIADDTKDELEKVMTRVETIYSSFEDSEQAYNTSNLEYLQDIAELEELIKDQVKKKKYQQQVTIFIVGFSDVSGQKLRLMQQVNEFFTENSKNIEEEDWFPTTPDLDLEEVGDKIEDSLQVARDLSHRLGDLNKEMVDFMANYAEKKASNKGKKKMEKALLQAREELTGLAEKLQSAQADVDEKEEKLQATFKQLELKNLEVQKFRTAAELAKKAVQETEELQEVIAERDAKLREQRQRITRLEIELAQSNHQNERSQNKLSNIGEESQQKITQLSKELEEQKQQADDARRDFNKFHDEQLTALREVHQQDMEDMKKQHAEQMKSLTTDLQRTKTELATTQHSLLALQVEKGVSDTQSEVGRQFDLDSEDGTSRQSSKQKAPMVIAVRQKRVRIKHKESRPSTKGRSGGLKKPATKSGGKDGKSSRTSTGSVASDDLEDDIVLSDLDIEPEPRADKEFSEVAIQDEGGDPNSAVFEEKSKTPGTRHSRRSRSTLAPVEEFEDYDDVYELSDEQAWASIPKDQMEGRFAQYRRITQQKLRDTEEQRQLTVAKTQRKVQLLKAQFVEHKTKWEAERKVLISQVEQAQQLQTDAEKEADQAMTQLEDFIAEQERLEEEEEARRSEILRGASSTSLSAGAQTPATRTPLPPSTPALAATAQPTPPESRNTQSSEELQNLMQQTDDAKSQRQESKQVSPSPSLTPGAMGALLDVSRVPVHKRQPSPTPSPTPAEATPRVASQTSSQGKGSPVIVEAPAAASEKAVEEVAELTEQLAEEIVVEQAAETVEAVEAEVVEIQPEVVESVDGPQAISPEAQAMEVLATPDGSSSAPGGTESMVPTSDLPSADGGSPLERGEFVSELPADLPIIMLMGGRVTPAAVLADSGARAAVSGQGSRSMPGSRQSRRVLIMQPKSMPGSALRVRTGLGTITTEPPSGMSSSGSFVPMALDVAALMNPKADTPYSPTPTPSAPTSAALQRDTTQSGASIQREATQSGVSIQREATQSGVSVQREATQSGVSVQRDVTLSVASEHREATLTSAGMQREATKTQEETAAEKSATPAAVEASQQDQPTTKEPSQISQEGTVVSTGKEGTDLEKKDEKFDLKTAVDDGDVQQDVKAKTSEPAVSEAHSVAQTQDPATLQVEELRGRLTGTKSAPPGVDMATVTPDGAQGQATADAQGGQEPQRAKTATDLSGITTVPIVKGTQLLQLAALDSISAGMTVPVIYGEGRQMALFDLMPGLVTPYPTPADPDALQGVLTTTFLTPEGQLVVTDPMSPLDAAKQGLMAVEVHTTPQTQPALSREVSGVRPGGSAGILRSGRPSPALSPTRQVSFSLGETVASSPREGLMSPRLSRLRRSRTGEGMPSDLSVVMETTLPAAQESALENMRKMLMEENLAPQQQQTLESMRSAMSRIKSYKVEERGQGDGSSRLTSDELLRTMTVLTLASQLTHEAIKLGVRPNSIFRNFSRLDTHILSEMAPHVSLKGQPEGASRETTAPELLPSTTDVENTEGATQETAQAVALEELQDLPPINGTSPDETYTPSIQPPPTAATMGSLPRHDQLETPLAEIAEQEAAALAKGDKQAAGELKEDVSNLEKSRTNVTEDRQATQMSEAKTGGEGYDGGIPEAGYGGEDSAAKPVQTPSKTPDATFKIEGNTEEDIREASARSRASLRSHYKNRLEESRQAAEDRRTKSPHITLPSNMSVDDELVLADDDDEDFDDMALPDDLKEELEEQRRKEMSRDDTGTSPPPGPSKDPSAQSHYFIRKSNALVDHPILQEYLRTYHCVTDFKDTMSKLLLDKDMMSASQIIADLETLAFDKDRKVMPQVEMLTSNVIYILEEIASVINSAVMIDREPPVSSLLPFSRDEMRSRLPPTREASEDLYPAYSHPKMVTPATGFTAQAAFTANVPVGEAPAATVGGDDIDAVAAVQGKAVEVARRDGQGSDGGEGVAVVEGPLSPARSQAGSQGGSQAGSLQGSRKSSVSGSTKQHLADLQDQCSSLQTQLEEESKKHEEQLRHNTVVMMEMQDTINELQRELSAIGKASKKPRSAASSALGMAKTPSPDQSLLFTRLDLERNAKTMKKAVMDQRLTAEKYKEAVTTMDDYVSLPAQRLAHLVKKYVHHSRMKEIEENVKNSESLDEGVFDTLDKMEALQNQRARQWAEKMDSMGLERLRLAAMLMDSLDSIEQESGLFLIKPMYSYRGRELKAPPTQKLARPVRSQPVPRHQSAAHESTTSFVPAPTPASNIRRLDRQTPTHQPAVDLTALPPPPPSRPEDGVVGAGAIRSTITPQIPQVSQSYHTWNMSASQARSPPLENLQHPLNTPRMLELDINRMLIGQNNVSTRLPHPPTDDRLVNASNNSLRSYVTVQRPTAPLASDRPPSATGGRDAGAPPSSPRPPVAVSPADRDIPQNMTSPPPLPPIGDRAASETSSHHDDPEPPRSPPGSSMYQSTTRDVEDGSVMKEATRPSSQLTDFSDTDQE